MDLVILNLAAITLLVMTYRWGHHNGVIKATTTFTAVFTQLFVKLEDDLPEESKDILRTTIDAFAKKLEKV